MYEAKQNPTPCVVLHVNILKSSITVLFANFIILYFDYNWTIYSTHWPKGLVGRNKNSMYQNVSKFPRTTNRGLNLLKEEV